MANMDPFSAQIVHFVRTEMSDEAILELVLNKLAPEAAEVAAESARAPAAPRTTASRAKSRSKSKKATTKKAATPKQKANRKHGGARTDRSADMAKVESVIKGSKGLSASEIAKMAKLPQSRVSNLVRALKGEGRIFQGGDRRFARYAGDAKTATAASEHARKNASGPKR